MKDGLPLIELHTYLVLEHILQFSIIAPLSGRVLGTRYQISTGAQAPVVPALTRALHFIRVHQPLPTKYEKANQDCGENDNKTE